VTTKADIERLVKFRNILVAHMNFVLEARTGYGLIAVDPAAQPAISANQPWLATEYGRLFKIINRYGGMSMSSRAAGITSYDVIADAIHDVGDVYYNDIARFAQQHLDTLIGRLQGEMEEAEEEPTHEAPPARAKRDGEDAQPKPRRGILQRIADHPLFAIAVGLAAIIGTIATVVALLR
jgi:hypothetical protein